MPEHRHHQESRRRLHTASSALPARAGRGRAPSVGGTICNWGFLVHSSPEIDLLVVRDLDLSRCVRSCPAPVPFDALEHDWIRMP